MKRLEDLIASNETFKGHIERARAWAAKTAGLAESKPTTSSGSSSKKKKAVMFAEASDNEDSSDAETVTVHMATVISILDAEDSPDEDSNRSTAIVYVAAAMSAPISYSLRDSFIFDLGATIHLCNNRSRFIDY